MYLSYIYLSKSPFIWNISRLSKNLSNFLILPIQFKDPDINTLTGKADIQRPPYIKLWDIFKTLYKEYTLVVSLHQRIF